MHKTLKQSMVLFLAATLIMTPFGSAALAQVEFERKEPSAGAMFADIVLVRPVGVASIAACTVLYAVVFPLALIGGNTKQAAKKLIGDPWKYTIRRPVGAF
ncbi:MAG: hypothetical protein PVI06_07800 [Desulfobacterales bacterium]|jgi:hypothetical protein